MEYHGFRSIKEYENECARVGFTTRRVPFRKDGEPYFALITTPPGHPTGTSIESWTLFTADETAQVLDGVINGHDANYLGKLSAHGYRPDNPRRPPPLPPRRSIPPPPTAKFVSCSDQRKALLYSALCCVIMSANPHERSACNGT